MRAKQFVPIVEAIQELFEVKMSPSSLKRLAGDIDALVGIEFEMMVPDVGSVDDDEYYEPEEDLDYDERAYDIDDVVRFFNDRDYNDSSSVRDLEIELRDRFVDWQGEQISEQWESEGKEYFAKWCRENIDEEDVADHVDKPEDLFGDRTPNKEDWEKFIEDEWEDKGYNYDKAYSEYSESKYDDGDFDEQAFLSDIGIDAMSDVQSRVRASIMWPHWTTPEGSGDAEYNLEQLADEFSEAIGRKVHYSTGYHGGPRTSDAYTIEPDSSLEDNKYKKDYDDAGLEFISPPLPIDEALEDVKKIKEWADQRGAYTTIKTGLHMNISVPGFDPENLDYVKLTLLLGDKTILNKFDRVGNQYCESAMEIIERAPTLEEKETLFKKLKDNLESIARKVVVSYGSAEVQFGPIRQRIGKFTSINPKDNRVEFRGPGGDWLGESFDKIEDTLYRCVVALDAAVDPDKYRKEYLKKLTKMFAPTKGSLEDIFVQYAAGTITREELKNKIKATQSQRRQEKLSKEGIVELSEYTAKDGDYIIEYDNPNGDNHRMFLKRTEQVNTPNKAMEVAIKLEPSWFKPDDIENIVVTEHSGLKFYAIVDEKTGRAVAQYSALTPMQATEYAVRMDSTLANHNLTARLASEYQPPEPPEQSLRMAPDETEFVVINNTLNQRVNLGARDSATALSRALRNNPSWDSYQHQIRVLSATPASEPEQQYQLYRVRGNGNSEYVSARSVGEAGRIALTAFPNLGDRVGDLDIVLQDADPNVVNMYLRAQQSAIDSRNNIPTRQASVQATMGQPQPAFGNGLVSGQPGEGMLYRVSDVGDTGGVTIRATSAQQAIDRARQIHRIDPSRELEATLY